MRTPAWPSQGPGAGLAVRHFAPLLPMQLSLVDAETGATRRITDTRGDAMKAQAAHLVYQFGWVLDSYLREARSGSGYGGGTSSESNRGYNDALKGKRFDTDRHPQDYKDGYRAGEEASRGGSRRGSSGDEYDINRLSNGDFEIVWTQGGCIATANRRGEILRCSSCRLG